MLPNFKIKQYDCLIPKCSEDIDLTFATTILILKLPENMLS